MASNYSPKIVTDGLVLCLDAADKVSYPGSGTTLTDLSGNGYNGTLTTAAICTDEVGVMTFAPHRSIDFGSLGTSGEYSQSTISLWWLKQAQTDSYGNLFDCNYDITAVNKGPRFEVALAETYVGVYLASDDGDYGGVNGGTGLSSDVWYNSSLTFTTDPGVSQTSISYLNGVYNNTAGTINSDYIWDGDIGALSLGRGFTSARYFTGKIANFQIYNRVLSAKEISQNFNAQRSRFGV